MSFLSKCAVVATALALSSTAQASVVYDAFSQFNVGAGTNSTSATWTYLAAKTGWTNSQATLLPDYAHRGYSTATKYNNENNIGLSLPTGEVHKWHSRFTYTGSVTYDTGIEWPLNSDGDGITELVTGIFVSPGFTGYGANRLPSRYEISDILIGFSPDIDEATTFSFDFGLASDFHINGGQDCNSNCPPGRGQNIGLFLNDSQMAAADFWGEDNDGTNGYKRADSEWVYLNDFFARFDDPMQIDFDLSMNPGDTFYLRLNNAGLTFFDGLILTEATASAKAADQEGDAGANPKTVPEPSTLALLGVGIAGLGFTRRRRRGVALFTGSFRSK